MRRGDAIASDEPRGAAAEIARSLVEVCDGLSAAYCAFATRILRVLVSDPHVLDGLEPARRDNYSRSLIYADPVGRFGIWTLWWPPMSSTPVHDHHCSCLFGVYRGQIEERLYRPAAGGDGVVQEACVTREAGYLGCAPLERPLIHRMANPCSDLAATIHIYGYNPTRFKSSIRRCFATSEAT